MPMAYAVLKSRTEQIRLRIRVECLLSDCIRAKMGQGKPTFERDGVGGAHWAYRSLRLWRVPIRPPETLVPKALCFTADVFFSFLFFSPRDLRAPSADRRETLPHDRNLGALYNASPKIRGALPQRNWGPKTCKIQRDF